MSVPTTATTHSAEGKVVLVTGASSGIGAATARQLAADGHRVVVGARRADRLAQLVSEIEEAGGSASTVDLDVVERDSMKAAVHTAVERYGRLDVLVNNAGVMPLSALAEDRVDEWDWMIDVNIRGVLHGISAALPVMNEQGSGHIVTVASIGAHAVVPTGVVYCATKYAVWAISEGLRIESDPSIRATTITPGVVESDLAESISDPAAREAMRDYRANAIPASAIADAIGYAVNADPNVDVNEIIVRPAAQRP